MCKMTFSWVTKCFTYLLSIFRLEGGAGQGGGVTKPFYVANIKVAQMKQINFADSFIDPSPSLPLNVT